MTEVGIDFETRGVVDLKKVGVTAYAQDADTDVYCVSFRVGDYVRSHDILGTHRYECPDYIVDYAKDKLVIWKAHNAAFERAVWRYILTPRYGWPKCPPRSRWVCTMSQAYAMALPGALDKVNEALRTSVRKDMEGSKLMKKMMKPDKWSAAGDPVYSHDTPANRARLRAYCDTDTLAEGANSERLLPLLPEEHASWQLDQLINDRGIFVDEDLCDACLDVIDEVRLQLHRRMAEITNQAVKKTDQTAALRKWLADKMDVEAVESVAKGVIEEYLGQELPGDRFDRSGRLVAAGEVRQALMVRQAAAKASAAKIDALLQGRSRNGRAHDLFQWHAASTGRWAGRRFQPHNLPRPAIGKKSIALAIDLIRQHRDPKILDEVFGEDQALTIVSALVRSLVVASPGKKLYCGDFSNIEGRGLAWEAGEDAKLEVFRLNDQKLGPDPYLVAAAAIYGVPVSALNKDSPERQVGKVAELALGYQGGIGAFHAMAGAYGVVLPDWKIDEAKVAWRTAHPKTVAYWKNVERAAVDAVLHPGRWFEVETVAFIRSGSFLFLELPSGRRLVYPYPRYEAVQTPWGERNAVTFMGTDTRVKSATKGKWTRLSTYGGKLVENITQAVARDVLRDAMFRLEDAGYEIVMHVHDEIVCEVDEDFGSLKEFEAIMAEVPKWAKGFPIKVEGWEGTRYRK